MASTAGSLQSSSSFSADTMQFLISPRNIKRFDHRDEKCGDPAASREQNNLGLVDYDSLPEFLKHNEFIVNYYRSEWPLRETLLSLFSIHNETLNVWTHLIGFFIFLVLAGYAASIFPVGGAATGINDNPMMEQIRSGNSSIISIPFHDMFFVPTYQTPIPNTPLTSRLSRWPFYIYLAGAMFCLLMSSACHLLSCHSARTSYVMLRLDFAGISGLIVSSFYPLVYYTFACHPFFRNVYLCSITVFGLATIVISLVPVFDSPQFRPVRAVLFACMAASGIVPIAHKMLAFGHRPEAVLTTGYEAVMAMFYGLGVVVYALRVPERWLPGKFDLAGHSHQLFHVLVVAGAYTHYLASVVYLGWREAEGC
ncbi:hypothetical protein KSP39_PZI019744 [Platanthera zijinensis]|uniref:Heptahelical transmembrane protein 4-like n=1 Tax=Platanthera zijinensis TaxID=2320716 RepID=A0AAP0FXR8_9ASPA